MLCHTLLMSFTSLLSVPLKLVTAEEKKETGLEILKLCCKAACLELLPVRLLPHIFFLLGNFSGVKRVVCVSV